MAVVDIPEPGDPGPGEVLVRPEAVGLCGSDFHYYLGDISAVDDSERFPRTRVTRSQRSSSQPGPLPG